MLTTLQHLLVHRFIKMLYCQAFSATISEKKLCKSLIYLYMKKNFIIVFPANPAMVYINEWFCKHTRI